MGGEDIQHMEEVDKYMEEEDSSIHYKEEVGNCMEGEDIRYMEEVGKDMEEEDN
jgi:hypothetical protein